MRLFSDVTSRVSDPYLAHAAALAVRARGAAWPNPLVGCVVVADGHIVGEGFHPRAGEPHAEVFALRDAGEAARGAEVYVTLEPCAHHGRTAPCAQALIDAGVARVIIGMRDPHQCAAGGVELLRAAGVEVVMAANPLPFAEINEGWLKRIASGMPFVSAKIALSLDGRMGFSAGQRASITGVSGARVTRQLRTACDAVMVSAATLIADDPQLTVRDEAGRSTGTQPLRVVLVRDTCPPAAARVFTDGLAETVVLAADDADISGFMAIHPSVRVERWDRTSGLGGVFRALGSLGIGEVLVEPGPRLLTSLWEAGALDQLVTVTAGGMAGAGAFPTYVGQPDQVAVELMHRMSPLEAGIVGDVSVTVWRPVVVTNDK